MYKWTDMYKCTWTWIYFTTVWFNWIEAARTLKTSKLDTDSFSFAKKLAEEDDILEYVNDQNFHIIQSHLDQSCIMAFQTPSRGRGGREA